MKYDDIKVKIHYFMPKHIITVLIGCFASLNLGKITTFLIKKFIKAYNINTDEIKNNISDFKTFNDFFARELKQDARSICSENNSIISPVDGNISQYGNLIDNIQIQAKGHYFSINALLADDNAADIFKNGKFITIYLSPSDYHRVHMPVNGKLLKMTYIPGEFFSVNPLYVQNIPELFARNERVVCLFDTSIGKMTLIFVGATIVRSVSTAWDGVVAPNNFREITSFSYEKENISYDKGDEIGKFMMGSTVICLFEKDKIDFTDLKLEEHILMGEKIAQFTKK